MQYPPRIRLLAPVLPRCGAVQRPGLGYAERWWAVRGVRHHRQMASTRATPPTYLDRLRSNLDLIETDYVRILDDSQIRTTTVNHGNGYVTLGAQRS